MTACSKWLALAGILLMTTPAIAGLKDIRREKLPQEKAIQRIYTDVLSIEAFVREWSDKWRYETPKSNVASLLKASLSELRKAIASRPDNEELLLLTGLVAHYAYNVDVGGSYEVAVDALEKARKLAPEDYRPAWFLGVHQCQATQSAGGMERLLSIERALPWEQLPPSFWDEYLFCATITNMPAHALRAGDRATKLKAPPSKDRDFLMQAARNRFETSDPVATYPSNEAWSAKGVDSQKVFTNTACGFAFSSRGDWRLNLADVQKGFCVAQIQIGPHTGKRGDVFPTILVLVRQPKEGETLSDFLKTISSYGSAKPTSVTACPAQECLASEIVKPGAYEAEGDGHFIITAFKRDSPEFPGLLFEEPMGLPTAGSEKVQYFHPTERLHRFAGILYYFVGLDTAGSVLGKAQSDYEAFLMGIQVE